MMTEMQFLLMKLAEEATEVAQIALKTAQFGLYEKHSELYQNNIERVESEFNDLMAAVRMINDHNDGYLIVFDIKAQNKKIEKVNKYLGYSRELGLVEPKKESEDAEN